MGTVNPVELQLRGSARVWSGGSGHNLLLLHGAWSGAAAHWSSVWEHLAERYRVIAPDLPGLGDLRSPGLGSAEAYVQWCAELLSVLDAARVWFIGNSFGAGIAARFASRHPDRVRGLVLVNGVPPPALPTSVLPVLRWAPVRAALTAFFRRDAYSAATLARAFADPTKCPDEIAETCTGAHPERLRTVVDVVLAGDAPVTAPSARTLLIWGSADALIGSSLKDAEHYANKLPAAQLRVVDEAGHLPQVEQPETFVEVINDFCTH